MPTADDMLESSDEEEDESQGDPSDDHQLGGEGVGGEGVGDEGGEADGVGMEVDPPPASLVQSVVTQRMDEDRSVLEYYQRVVTFYHELKCQTKV